MKSPLLLGMVLAGMLTLVSGAAVAAESVRVAVAGPMVGTSYAVGVQSRDGVAAALETLPDGKLLGRSIELTLYDDNCKDTIAVGVAQQIVEDPPAVVIGHSCSAATLAAAPIYAEHEVLQITPASTNPKVTEMGIHTIFRMIGRDDTQGKLAADRIAQRHAGQKIGIVHFPGAYSTGLTDAALAAMKEHGITPAINILAEAEAPSYASEIDRLISNGIEVLYLVGGGLDSGIFMRQVRQMGADFDVISSDTIVSDVFLQAAGAAAENTPFTFPPPAVELATAAPAVASIKAKASEPAGYTLLAYAAIQVWIEGVTRAQSFDTSQVAAAIRSKPINTILGNISFDEKGDIMTPYAPFAWYVWKEGRRVPIE